MCKYILWCLSSKTKTQHGTVDKIPTQATNLLQNQRELQQMGALSNNSKSNVTLILCVRKIITNNSYVLQDAKGKVDALDVYNICDLIYEKET